MYEVERGLVYVSFALASPSSARRSCPSSSRRCWRGSWPSPRSLATRLLPDRVGTFDSFAGYRLSEPLGYWNALSIFAAAGSAVAVRPRGQSGPARSTVRALSAASLVLLSRCSSSRSEEAAGSPSRSGLAAVITVDPRRLQLARHYWSLLLARARRLGGSTSRRADHRFSPAHRCVARRRPARIADCRPGRRLRARDRRATRSSHRRSPSDGVSGVHTGLALALGLVGCVAALITAYGGPAESARRALDSIKQAPPNASGAKNRLFSLSSNGRLDTWESALDDYQAHATLGAGAGTFERWWLQIGASGSRFETPTACTSRSSRSWDRRSGRAPGDVVHRSSPRFAHAAARSSRRRSPASSRLPSTRGSTGTGRFRR